MYGFPRLPLSTLKNRWVHTLQPWVLQHLRGSATTQAKLIREKLWEAYFYAHESLNRMENSEEVNNKQETMQKTLTIKTKATISTKKKKKATGKPTTLTKQTQANCSKSNKLLASALSRVHLWWLRWNGFLTGLITNFKHFLRSY